MTWAVTATASSPEGERASGGDHPTYGLWAQEVASRSTQNSVALGVGEDRPAAALAVARVVDKGRAEADEPVTSSGCGRSGAGAPRSATARRQARSLWAGDGCR